MIRVVITVVCTAMIAELGTTVLPNGVQNRKNITHANGTNRAPVLSLH